MSNIVVGVKEWLMINGQSLGVVQLRATIFTQTGAKRIRRKIRESKISEAAKEPRSVRDVLVYTNDKLIIVTAGAAGFGEVVSNAAAGWGWEVSVPHLGSRGTEFRQGNLVVGIRRTVPVRLNCIGIVQLNTGRGQRRKITLAESCHRNCRGQGLTLPKPELFPTGEEESLVLNYLSA